MATENQSEQNGTTFPAVVFADFVCPWSYMVQDHIDQLVVDYDLQPMWKPHWLHPEVPPEGQPRPESPPGTERRTAMREWMKELAPEKAATLRPMDKMQYSFRAFEALTYAEDRGKALPFKTAVFDALWAGGQDIGEISTLQQAADKVGLDGEELGRALHEGEYAERTLETVNTVRRVGITQTPTIILGKTKIPGYHYYEVLQTVLEKQGIMPREKAASES